MVVGEVLRVVLHSHVLVEGAPTRWSLMLGWLGLVAVEALMHWNLMLRWLGLLESLMMVVVGHRSFLRLRLLSLLRCRY